MPTETEIKTVGTSPISGDFNYNELNEAHKANNGTEDILYPQEKAKADTISLAKKGLENAVKPSDIGEATNIVYKVAEKMGITPKDLELFNQQKQEAVDAIRYTRILEDPNSSQEEVASALEMASRQIYDAKELSPLKANLLKEAVNTIIRGQESDVSTEFLSNLVGGTEKAKNEEAHRICLEAVHQIVESDTASFEHRDTAVYCITHLSESFTQRTRNVLQKFLEPVPADATEDQKAFLFQSKDQILLAMSRVTEFQSPNQNKIDLFTQAAELIVDGDKEASSRMINMLIEGTSDAKNETVARLCREAVCQIAENDTALTKDRLAAIDRISTFKSEHFTKRVGDILAKFLEPAPIDATDEQKKFLTKAKNRVLQEVSRTKDINQPNTHRIDLLKNVALLIIDGDREASDCMFEPLIEWAINARNPEVARICKETMYQIATSDKALLSDRFAAIERISTLSSGQFDHRAEKILAALLDPISEDTTEKDRSIITRARQNVLNCVEQTILYGGDPNDSKIELFKNVINKIVNGNKEIGERILTPIILGISGAPNEEVRMTCEEAVHKIAESETASFDHRLAAIDAIYDSCSERLSQRSRDVLLKFLEPIPVDTPEAQRNFLIKARKRVCLVAGRTVYALNPSSASIDLLIQVSNLVIAGDEIVSDEVMDHLVVGADKANAKFLIRSICQRTFRAAIESDRATRYIKKMNPKMIYDLAYS